jgi:hypothetical protein
VYLSFSLCYIDERDVLAQAADFSLSLIPIGETTFTRARARDIYIDTCIDSIRCVRLILTNLLLSSPSSSSRAVLFFLGSAVSPLSLSRPNRTNERTRKRERKRVLSLTSSSLASRIFLLSSSDPETRKYLLFFFFPHRIKGLSRGGGRYRR